jgi:hypothetical protein
MKEEPMLYLDVEQCEDDPDLWLWSVCEKTSIVMDGYCDSEYEALKRGNKALKHALARNNGETCKVSNCEECDNIF